MKSHEFITESMRHLEEKWSKKYKSSINCSHPKGFSQKAHCAGKRKQNESVEKEMVCEMCGMCQTHGDHMMEMTSRLDAKCWSGMHKAGTKIKGGVRVNNCVPNESVAEDLSRRGFLRGAGAAAVAGAAGPEIVTLVKGFAEQAGGMNGIQALKAMLKIATPDELYNMYEYYADSGILEDAITDSDMIALDRAGYDSWSEFEEHCDENGVDPDDEFQRLTGRPLKVKLVDDIVGKVDDTWSLEEFFDEYPDALKIINPFENGSISMPTMQQLAKIDTAAKGASLPTPIVAMANAVAGLVRQIFKANGQSLSEPEQVAQPGRAAPALPAPTKPEFDFTPNLKSKEKVPVQRQGGDEEQYYRPAPEHIQQALDAGELGDKNFFQSIVNGTHKNPWVTPEKAQEILNKYYSPQKPDKKQGMSEGICSLEEAHEIFDDFERAMAARGLTEDIFETITDEQIIRETAAWRRKAGKSAKGGLNAKGVASYRRENPGSKLQMAVTTKPSKLKPGSKAAKRRKSFCARMSGVKGPMKKPNGKPTRKALALRKWNC